MVKLGMMIADRYEIIEKIGTGGMSDVYRAKCHKLNRFVAVKTLKQEFSENKDFVSKFRVEAQAAAGLMHPNIVNVYDVGEEKGIHYIVMELVEGITLKRYIEKKARLSVKEAVSIAIQVAMGIEAAHNNHIIHRDIKPQNIIISKEGKVKVTDFGIAKAATSNTVTSNVMGSVHYTSPEQVRGGFSDEKSDIYSLGVTLFEMLTGRVPFNGETTVAVAIKHIQETMPSVRDYVPEIPISVEQIVKKCTQKSPDRRYQSAPELIEDLKKSLISPEVNFVKLDEADTSGATKNVTSEELRQIKAAAHQKNLSEMPEEPAPRKKADEEPLDNRRNREEIPVENYREGYSEDYLENYSENYENVPQVPRKKSSSSGKNSSKGSNGKSNSGKNPNRSGNKNGTKNSGKSGTKSNSKNPADSKNRGKSVPANKNGKKNSSPKGNRKKPVEEEYDPKMEFLTTVMIVIVAVIVGCVFLYFVGNAVGIFDLSGIGQENNQEQVEMISVAGYTAEEAANSLRALGLSVNPQYQESSTVAENIVISASAQPGDKVAVGSEITIYISSGVNGVPVPGVLGLSRPEAIVALENEGFQVTVTKENSDTVARDNVISSSPEAGTKMPRGSEVAIVVSLGAEIIEVPVPNILNMTEEEAKAALAEAGLSGVMVLQEYSDTIEAGKVTYQNYAAGVAVNSGTEVEFKISLGVEEAYYNCVATVMAPPDYAGGDAVVELRAMDGTQIFSTTTSNFPVYINETNIFAKSSGEIIITYNVYEQQNITDEAGNVTVQNVLVQRTSEPQPVSFIKVQ